MYLLDVNVVLAAYREDHPHHRQVRPWFDALVEAHEPFGVPGSVWVSFVRLATHRLVFTVPSSRHEAFAFLHAVIEQPGYSPLDPGGRHLEIFEQLCGKADVTGDLAVDTSLAAMAIEYGCTLASIDRDFARFPGLSWVVPGANE